MANKKRKPQHGNRGGAKHAASAGGDRFPVRLSQCMIVKNEEKNIIKALSWAKGIAFEQIVVDTGSTDRTVELAEAMGARVCHFEWINDFSAAKNYAIEQCKGNWIAFLDADEYFSESDAHNLMQMLRTVESDPGLRQMKTALSCPWVQLNDEGQAFLVLNQYRVFRNTPEIRYVGSIHETLTLPVPPINAPDISIMHTGYSKTSYEDTGKAIRNIEMIEAELEKRPDDATLKCYLADSLRIEGPGQDRDRAEALYREALGSGNHIPRDLEQGAYNYLIGYYYYDEEKTEENFELCKTAYEKYPQNPDFCFFYGRKLHLNGEYEAALEKFTECENLLKGRSVGLAGFILKNSLMLFFNMVLTAEELGRTDEIIRCATLLLKEDKNQPGMLSPYIAAFNRKGYNTPAEEILKLLGRIYDLNDMKDKIMIMRAAVAAKNNELAQMLMSTFTQEELAWLTAEPDAAMLEAMQKEADEKFAELMDFAKSGSEESIFEHIRDKFSKLSDGNRATTAEYFKSYHFWGALDLRDGNYESFQRRAKIFAERHAELEWLYGRLGDAYSKRTLTAILSNWLNFDIASLNAAKETRYSEYFDKSLIQCGADEVFVDLGAYNGDSAYSFINNYKQYKRIYCYEITPDVFEKLQKNLAGFTQIEYRFKGAGARPGKMYVSSNAVHNSANELSDAGETEVDIVRIDDDISEPVTFIKMDIEGAEKDALRGCERQIRENRPKLAICTYHGYDDLYEIPRMIERMDPSYRFYMRYHGGDLIPTEFHLLAL